MDKGTSSFFHALIVCVQLFFFGNKLSAQCIVLRLRGGQIELKLRVDLCELDWGKIQKGGWAGGRGWKTVSVCD